MGGWIFLSPVIVASRLTLIDRKILLPLYVLSQSV
jgi:hypothetical protein